MTVDRPVNDLHSSDSAHSVTPTSRTVTTNALDSELKPACLQRIRIVLVEPAGPLNVGAIARVMKNMGLSQLVLVNPHCNIRDEAAVRMAVHAVDVLVGAKVVCSLEEALRNCRGVAGTVGRTQPMEFEIGEPHAILPQLLLPDNSPAALVFGPEDRGLNNRELGMCQQQIFIPTSNIYPSMNLAQAVGICAYELRQAALAYSGGDRTANGKTRDREPTTASTKAPSQALEGFYQHLEQVLLQIGFLYPHTAPRKLLKFRRLFDRAQLTLKDVALLRGVLRQLAWADRNLSTPRSQPSQSSADAPTQSENDG